jgi:uncharacterized protein (DUF983 family)
MPLIRRLRAIVAQRCPVCCEGKVFKSLWGMNTHCPVCGIKFERETGYFLNSMFIGYAVGLLILVPTAVVLFFLNVDLLVFSTVIIVVSALVWPLVFRYARVLWMHADQMLDPRRPEH